MARIALFLFVLFAFLLVLRALRMFFAVRSAPPGRGTPIEGEMVRDPVCGTWVDRRIALAVRQGDEWLPVCSEKCRRKLDTA
ncbi:MAG: hypothetical protein ABI592_15800 [Acidobacteriota bacterium]